MMTEYNPRDRRAFYSSTIAEFLASDDKSILGELNSKSKAFHDTLSTQQHAWESTIEVLKRMLEPYRNDGKIYLEYVIPRLGGRIDALLWIRGVVFVLELKVNMEQPPRVAIDQVTDYALDLKHFLSSCHDTAIVPVLIATLTSEDQAETEIHIGADGLLKPLVINADMLSDTIKAVLQSIPSDRIVDDTQVWEDGVYSPTPTIVEAAKALYSKHSVEEISRSDAGATNLAQTSGIVDEAITYAKQHQRKVICFVTGVPGSGKTLVGLDVATKHASDKSTRSVFLSGNWPLVDVLREALALDKYRRDQRGDASQEDANDTPTDYSKQGAQQQQAQGSNRPSLNGARRAVNVFVQNVHHFRDYCLTEEENPPPEHVAIFDEAQRAWNEQKLTQYMAQRKDRSNFNHSEPDYLISCMDRHKDWAVIVCLVGGGQEISIGEGGIREWFAALTDEKYAHWNIWVSPQLNAREYGVAGDIERLPERRVKQSNGLHLSVSMRSFRAEKVSHLVKQILDLNLMGAKQTLGEIGPSQYPIHLTRDLDAAKQWLRDRARGTERYGMVVSSHAVRLRPYAIDVARKIKPEHWFLKGKDDVRSSYYLEDAATEFKVQGLELDWVCVVWDADLRHDGGGDEWEHRSFRRGNRWEQVKKAERKSYLQNAYRVLLTRARQGMVIVVPEGDESDHTRCPSFYNPTYEYLREVGLPPLQ